MCDGISLNMEDLPLELIRRFALENRIVRRSETATPEIRFLHRAKPRRLPAWFHSRLEILTWGNADGRILELPRTSWIERERLEVGDWKIPLEKVVIPAALGFDRGIWYQIKEGIVGLVASRGTDRALFMLTEEASHYYRTMTRNDRMPVFIGERI